MGFSHQQSGKQDKPRTPPKRSRRAIIMRAAVAPLLLLLAVVAIGWGYLNATQWEPSKQITSKTSLSDSPRYVVTDPGMLTLVGQRVDVSVDVADSGQEVCIALGSARDVAGWTAGHEYTRITGLQDWNTLMTEQEPASGSTSSDEGTQDAVGFKDSDLWVDVACDEGGVTLKTQQVSDGQIAIVDLGGDVNQAEISMHWVRDEIPDYATPLYVVGGLLAVAALMAATVFAMSPQSRRKQISSRSHVEPPPDEVTLTDALSGSISALASNARAPVIGRRRRGPGQLVNLPEELNESGAQSPAIVDPTARNMLAERPAKSTYDQDRTEVIEVSIQALEYKAKTTKEKPVEHQVPDGDTTSTDAQELQDYLSRLRIETMPPPAPPQTKTKASRSSKAALMPPPAPPQTQAKKARSRENSVAASRDKSSNSSGSASQGSVNKVREGHQS